jgi:hypothetical protein
MIFAPFIAPLIGFVFRELVVKFVVFTAVFALVGLLSPIAIGYLGSHLSTSSLGNSFAGLSPGVWFFLDAFQLPYGVPLLISAWVARFLIRRLPVIG